ncbi:MAG: hypothetical protein ACEY26_00870 [Candidatus Hodgkinia cicadicola]
MRELERGTTRPFPRSRVSFRPSPRGVEVVRPQGKPPNHTAINLSIKQFPLLALKR